MSQEIYYNVVVRKLAVHQDNTEELKKFFGSEIIKPDRDNCISSPDCVLSNLFWLSLIYEKSLFFMWIAIIVDISRSKMLASYVSWRTV